MSIQIEHQMLTLVLLAKRPARFNPSEINQYWLDVNGVIPAHLLHKTSIFSPSIVQASSDKLKILVTEDQIQIILNTSDHFKEIVTENCSPMIKAMESVNLFGFGLNFYWNLSDDKIPYSKLSTKYFKNPSSPITQFFQDNNAMFGCYMSQDINEVVRLKLDIKPMIVYDTNNDPITSIQCIFNFHSDLRGQDQKGDILKILLEYEDMYKITLKVMESFN